MTITQPARTQHVPISEAAAVQPLKKVAQYYIVTAFLALLIGVLIGPLQALNYGNINLYNLPILRNIIQSYYQGLTLHGVLNALVFTQFFISGWMLYLPARDLNMRPNLKFAWFSYWAMTLGLLIAAVPILMNNASVLYTFYPPLKGSPLFYIGAGLMVGSSWFVAWQVIGLWWSWKRAHRGQITPLVTYMCVVTWMMWIVASLGLVVEVLVLLIPWSLGLTAGVDPLLSRTLFWWTGHPIVYFWLLPAYISWYAFIPKQAGGRLASDPLTRLAFAMFLLFSTPVGLHHQYSDPNISPLMKTIQMCLTFMVAIPSLLTAFSLAASLEDAARARGGSGLFGWMAHLPWKNASFTAQVLAMISFIFGGAGGFINASAALDTVIHNTAWIPGHFHITVGTATTLTFMGIAFWWVPHLTGKPLFAPKAALWSAYTWFIGMMIFAVGMHWQGLLGVPRRAQISNMGQDVYQSAHLPQLLTAISGGVLFIASILFFTVLFGTLWGKRRSDGEDTPIPWSQAISTHENSRLARRLEALPAIWVMAFVLVLLTYGPVIGPMLANSNPVPGLRLW
ncbi:ba3-type cytochrome C oxidase subunit I [Deinococcus rubellus]|uniref:B(O/a)3-type cytochrome-c oxidase subunit 1 n=1 Tax=Deinococcus rubellus TaxID=1889240 RepID=A0ABY5YKA9_9DEIO|nr:b(o/a)3-type cytochrome-c oxidase subunit 1 [Deinococcus rubellus]UWX65534.1 b(o/a)3-type cytochrome-c oxidase subunit 1 [Deinococcus rubellus]